MTKIICHTDDKSIYFDCNNHAGDKDVCLQISAVCNVLVCHAISIGVHPQKYESGKVHIDIDNPSEASKEVFASCMQFLHVLAEEYSDYIKIY